MKMSSITQTIETSDFFLLNCLSDAEFSNYVDFGTVPRDLTPADIELSFEDMCLPIQCANEELPAESQLMETSLGITTPDSGLVASTAEPSLEPLVETCSENAMDTDGKTVCESKSAPKAGSQIEV